MSCTCKISSVARLVEFIPSWVVLIVWVKIGLGEWKNIGQFWDQFGVFTFYRLII